MAPVRVKPDRAMQVQACLATVMDPELDESVTELGFITELVLQDSGEVRIGFRLPTYWCAANFAFLMSDDMRNAVQTLPWVTKVEVRLHDHMYAEAINNGVAQGAGFQAAFGSDAEGNLEALRQTFLVKAFQRRQEALLDHLIAAGYAPADLLVLDIYALQDLSVNGDGMRLVDRYLERRSVVGNGPRAFVDTAEQPIAADQLGAHRRSLRSVGVNAEFNGTLCRGLLAVRDKASVTSHPIHIVRQPRAVSTS
jgi:metal-sulfur cluster biosynthetic enzyme